jgi:type I restriction enzyme S subunit
MPKDMIDGRVDISSISRVDEATIQRLRAHVLQLGDIALARRGEIGRCAWIGEEEAGWLCGTGTMRITVGSGELNPRFLFLYLQTTQASAWLSGHAVGATMSNLSATVVEMLPVRYPGRRTQEGIVAAIDSLQDLIEANRRRIQILEQTVRLIYREWFVYLRFPGNENHRFIESEVGPIPEDWAVNKLGDVLELEYGRALKESERRGGSVAVFGSSGIIGWHDEPHASGPGIIVGRKGNVGSLHWSEGDFFPIDTTYFVRTELPLLYTFHLLGTLQFIDSHAAVPGLSREQAYGLPLAVPTRDLTEAFEEIARPMFDLRHNLKQQIAIVRQFRDLLIPRLVAGELDISHLGLQTKPAA